MTWFGTGRLWHCWYGNGMDSYFEVGCDWRRWLVGFSLLTYAVGHGFAVNLGPLCLVWWKGEVAFEEAVGSDAG
jgi:hypothetical protein